MSETIRQGLQVGRRWPAEARAYTDRETGARVRMLTDGYAHTHHLYFTNPGWYDEGRRLLVGSERSGAPNLYSVDVASGVLTQLTDLPPAQGDFTRSFLNTCVNPTRPEAYFWLGKRLVALALDSLRLRLLYEAPREFSVNITNVTADGAAVCTGLYEDLSDRFEVDLLRGYVGFQEYWEANPLSRVIRVATDGGGDGKAEVLHEEHAWIGHVNTSPARPELLTFCHEGPWQRVDQRIWGLNADTREVWKIRPTAPGERVGHEYWLADGERIGYHGHDADGEPFYGFTRYDDSQRVEATLREDSTHFHSSGSDWIVGDGTRTAPYILVWGHDGETGAFTPAHRVTMHRGSFQVQQVHVHPRFSPDGTQVLFTSDETGYGNPHLVDLASAGLPVQST